MSLFDVPGWSMTTPPIQPLKTSSKKRKRPSSTRNLSQLEAAEHNVNELLSQLSSTQPKPGSLKRSKTISDGEPLKKKKRHSKASLEVPLRDQKFPETKDSSLVKQKKTVAKKDKPAPNSASSGGSLSGALTTLQKGMKQSLDGARFRLINENLYKSDGHEAHKMMQDDPKIFEDYHIGFRHQVLSWPTNPVDHFIEKFSSYPQRTIVVDLGCGDAALAKNLVPRGIAVLSYDLVPDGQYVIEADICKKVPLPGSEGRHDEKSSGEGQIVDVVVCALSLMGTNWVNCLREAWRVLKPSGQLHIAEVTSRFIDIEQFAALVGSIGFSLKSKDTSNTHFALFEFAKVDRCLPSEKTWMKLLGKGSLLKPCEYKRR